MKVRDLIGALQRFDPELTVMGFSEDEDVCEEGMGPVPIFEIVSLDATNVSTYRDDNSIVRFVFEQPGDGQTIVAIQMTRDF